MFIRHKAIFPEGIRDQDTNREESNDMNRYFRKVIDAKVIC